MGKEIYENYGEVRSLFEEAGDALGYDIARLCFDGPSGELNKTYRTQPSLLTVSTSLFKVLSSRGIRPSVVAGHSLGEYSALVAAGVLPFRDAVVLTEKRGHFMQEAVPEGKGLMAAVMGLPRSTVNEICLSLRSGYASPANYNCPGQIVIAGEKMAVEEAMNRAKDEGAKRVVALAVSVPSHCTLMAEASRRLEEYLKGIELKSPSIPLVNNAEAAVLTTADSIRASLVRQLDSPLLWEDSVLAIVDSGTDTFVEVGPGKVLSGLIKRITSSAKIYNVENVSSLDKTVTALMTNS
jgi:[acyl-carrier-protein] S-malonyltransferase